MAPSAARRTVRAALRGGGPGRVIVAIDGPAGSGKSAAGRRLAAALNLPFVDSGLYYRA
ncbi:MAG: (d)CMP kinase, partial [Candidatus Dormibacteria bacterium]